MSRSKTAENRSRFIKRYKDALKKSIQDTFMDKKLADAATGGGKAKINKSKTLDEPVIYHGEGGVIDRVLPGNKDYSEGDGIPKPNRGYGQGPGSGDPSDSGEGMDDFTIFLDNKEFLDLLFDDLELPNLVKTALTSAKEVSYKHAGFSPDGNPSNLSVIKTYRNSLARRMAIRGGLEDELEELCTKHELVANEYNILIAMRPDEQAATADYELLVPHLLAECVRYEAEIAELKQRLENVPLFEDNDLRYRAKVKVETPSTHATMIMMMDNSGSMGEREKTIARKFFLLLYLFLRKSYEQVDMIFVSHTTEATEMTEEEFFNTRESGGTIVSSGLDMINDIIRSRGLIEKTNIYIAQVSDGDNVDTDNGTCTEILEDDILPLVRYFAYVQVDDYHMSDDSSDPYLSNIRSFGKGLWRAYEGVAAKVKHFNIKRVSHERDIYPVFRELFKKQEA